ncbi:MAG: Plug domain-containing protein, partial [Cyclobacteriaceae bacterium]|nr:Plug domain-containing protein [Cyclobacteriaceae bacterium]
MDISRLLKFVFIAFFGLCVAFQADAQDKKSKKKKKNKKTEISEKDTNKTASYLSLADLLRRKPGVSVQGQGSSTKVAIRGGSGAHGTDPLYVLDRQPVGNSYSQVAGMVDVNDIARI